MTLGKVAEIVMGQSPAGDTCNESGKGLPLLNGPTEFGPHHPIPVQYTIDPRKKAKPGDILFCVRGSTTGKMNWADREYAIGRGIAAIRHKRGEEYQHFLRGLIDFRLPELLAQATGSTFPNVSYDQLADLPWDVLTENEQRAIAQVLGALDDKIELNRRMNETLEALAQSLFKSWFVDATQSALPKGWRIGVLKDLAADIVGGDWGADKPTEEETQPAFCIRGADIPDLQRSGVGKMPTRYLKSSSLQKRQLENGDLAVEISGGSPTQSTGRPVLVSEGLLQRLEHPLVCSNFCRILKLKSRNTSKFVYLWLRWLYGNDELFQFETGTTGIKNFAFTIFSEKFELARPRAASAAARPAARRGLRSLHRLLAALQKGARQFCRKHQAFRWVG